MQHGPTRPRIAQITARNERDATKMVYVLGISLSLSIGLMGLSWIVPTLFS